MVFTGIGDGAIRPAGCPTHFVDDLADVLVIVFNGNNGHVRLSRVDDQ